MPLLLCAITNCNNICFILTRTIYVRISLSVFLIFFNWRIIALQSFVIFCHAYIHTYIHSIRISHRYTTHVPSLLNLWPTCLPIPLFSEVSQKEKYKYLILMHIWNLKRWHWWIYFQDSSGETDIENRPMDMVGGEEREGETLWRE